MALKELQPAAAADYLEQHRLAYPQGESVAQDLQLAGCLTEVLQDLPESGPALPTRLVQAWARIQGFALSLSYPNQAVLDKIKTALFGQTIQALEKGGLENEPYLSPELPAGFVYLQAGRYDRAIAGLQVCLPLNRNNSLIYGYLGDAYAGRGDTRVARQCYQEAWLLDPAEVDWDNFRDDELKGLARELMEDNQWDPATAREWLPSYARIQGLLSPKIITLTTGLKELLAEYGVWRKALAKKDNQQVRARLFHHGLILSDNEPALTFVKKVDLIEVRRAMKQAHSDLFARYLRVLAKERG
ncbi:MAG: hypothetical protein HQK57_15435 [Deltaproteobacteria bacterium]|nr:hypothetical protein [Deltaproteobacteria bacterium]